MADSTPDIFRMAVGPLQTNCYLVVCPDTRSALLIDPGDEPRKILAAAERKNARIEQILLTHTHPDHIGGLRAVKEATGASVAAHRLDMEMLEGFGSFFGLPSGLRAPLAVDLRLEGGEELAVGHLRGTVVHTPGHSPGSVTLAMGSVLFSGDTLFAQGVGRVDLPGGNLDSLLASIALLFSYPDDCLVYPGHGPATTIGTEKRDNPYVRLE